jgi:hypothetical protein
MFKNKTTKPSGKKKDVRVQECNLKPMSISTLYDLDIRDKLIKVSESKGYIERYWEFQLFIFYVLIGDYIANSNFTLAVYGYKGEAWIRGFCWVDRLWKRLNLWQEHWRFFWFSAIISKIQVSKLPTVPESQAPMHNGQFGERPNSIAVFSPQEAGTQEQSVV